MCYCSYCVSSFTGTCMVDATHNLSVKIEGSKYVSFNKELLRHVYVAFLEGGLSVSAL